MLNTSQRMNKNTIKVKMKAEVLFIVRLKADKNEDKMSFFTMFKRRRERLVVDVDIVMNFIRR